MWICSASSYGFVRVGAYLPSRSVVLYVFGVLISSGNSSSFSSSSSSSVSVSVAFRFWTIFNFPFSVSRSISSQRPYLPSKPVCSSGLFHRLCRSPVPFSFFVRSEIMSPKIKCSVYFFPVSDLRYFLFRLMYFILKFSFQWFFVVILFKKMEWISNRIFLFRWLLAFVLVSLLGFWFCHYYVVGYLPVSISAHIKFISRSF